MEILNVEYKNIYGALSGNLKFKRGENFLVGINGCGKTTVLNLINWVLHPSLPELCTLVHDLIKIDIKHGKFLYTIQSRIMEKEHELKVMTNDKSRDFKSIKTVLALEPRLIKGVDQEDLKSRYAHMAPEKHEVSTWSFLIEELPTPIFIGLERSVEDYSPDRSIQRSRKYPRGTEAINAVRAATGLMRDAYNSSRRRIVEINDELNSKVLQLSFSGIIVSDKILKRKSSAKNMPQKISQLKEKIISSQSRSAYSKALSESGVQNAVLKYLDDLAALLKADTAKDIWVKLNQQNFDRASKMLDLFQNHESKAMSVQLEINNFIKAVNMFIGDSGKCINFDEDTGVPYFTAGTENGKLRLSQLSSGEAQIVILLSYFAFLAKKGIPIIIDEPELSLHVKWQKDFVTAVKQVMPQECQTIMATHSPEICGADKVNVQPLLLRNSR
jgi:ABC-type lipoprotein export system ATPase subunit